MVDRTEHQGQAATPNDAAIQHQRERLLRQIRQQRLGHGQHPAVEGVGVMLEPASETGHEAFLLRAVARGVIGDVAEVGALSTDQAADQGNEGVEMAFAMAGGPRLKELHEALFYGTIAVVRVTHLLLLTVRSYAWKS